jgi:hypothetical protein
LDAREDNRLIRDEGIGSSGEVERERLGGIRDRLGGSWKSNAKHRNRVRLNASTCKDVGDHVIPVEGFAVQVSEAVLEDVEDGDA